MNNVHNASNASNAYGRQLIPTSEFLFQGPARKVDRHAHAAQRIEPKRRRVLREYCERDQNVFAKPMDALAARQGLVAVERLEPEVLHEARNLLALRLCAGRKVGADHVDIVQVGPRCKVMGKLAQRRYSVLPHAARPTDRCSIARDRRHVFVPKMQLSDAVAGTQARAVAPGASAARASDAKPENARWMCGIFDDRQAAPQPRIERKNSVGQPRMA